MIETIHSEIDKRVTEIRYNNKRFVEVKHGKWKKKPEKIVAYGDIYNVNIRYCSECGWEIRNPGWLKCEWYFCPNCGADMRGEK